ncbi:probable serine/threonine-protein kinase DDB_G0282963 isoform X2 [Vanessa cardui]|uniref:probable serine/threonine-protein kinase DDB_G0282963 isoform X2 n=1 Tax=Vanessa cardui TaxID=171605 RepID=UPI001F13BA95|nr:probable serine/threonine-protein kinase DDB_G0282963 isoform X2 [Vanessa cardui]
MKKRTISKLKSLFGSKKGKRQQEQQQSLKSSRSPSPDLNSPASTGSESFRPIQRTPPPTRVGPPPSPPVPTNPIVPVAPEPSGPLPLSPCPVCGRTFVPQSLAKHVKICEKMTVKKRKTFDSSRQRREGTDLEQYLPKNFGLPENSPFLEKSPPNTAKAAPKPKNHSVRSAIMKPAADLQKCPHCNRAFGLRAFERHVEWCADKAKILPAAPGQPPPHIADAKQRLNARTQYKAPPVRGRRSSQTREKSSNSRSASVESTRGISPPREYGDYRHTRTRASESTSSNDYHEENTAHVPVIRNSRVGQNNSSGDANVKARQARLARDLSSSRLDDNYDPFVSAAKQMKELMSSDTNIPKKNNNPKDSNRTLPSLRPKDKLSTSYRTENTKMIKDTINKTYQKTPTLQRMKSFGSSNNDNSSHSFGGRCSSFRLNRNDKKPSQKLNTTFTKSSKENISSTEKSYLCRNSNLNRSFSSYSNSSYSTPKLKDKIPKISQSMHHGFQRSTIKQPLKLDKINKTDEKKDFVNLDAILSSDNTSMTDSNYIDPRLINENDNLPINVNTILNNPDIISSMESLLTTENLPAKFDSFSAVKSNEKNNVNDSCNKIDKNENYNNNKMNPPLLSEFNSQYEKMMSSLEQSIASKTSIRDDDSLCEDFDLEEFMISFDEEVHKQKIENKRTCSSTTRIVAKSDLSNNVSSETKVVNSPKVVNSGRNGLIPVNKSNSLIFSSNNIVSDKIFPSSIKRSTSLLDSIQKKTGTKIDNSKGRHKTDQLEDDLMQSLKDFDKFYESERIENQSSNKEVVNNNKIVYNDKSKKEFRRKVDHKPNKHETNINGNYTPNGKSTNDSAYSSLNRISPSKLSLCNAKEQNGVTSHEQIPVGSDSNSSHKDDVRSISSEEFLAMERSAELDGPIPRTETHKELETPAINDKRVSSRASSRHSPTWRQRHETLSSSGSETSLHRQRRDSIPAPRLSRFCHECGNKFPVETAKFCIECGVKRLVV